MTSAVSPAFSVISGWLALFSIFHACVRLSFGSAVSVTVGGAGRQGTVTATEAAELPVACVSTVTKDAVFGTVIVPHCSAVYGPIVFVYVNVFAPPAALTTPSAPATESVTVTDSSTRSTVALLKSNGARHRCGCWFSVETACSHAVRGSHSEAGACMCTSGPRARGRPGT